MHKKKKTLIVIIVFISIFVILVLAVCYNKNQLANEPITYFFASDDPAEEAKTQESCHALYIYHTGDNYPIKIEIDGYRNLCAPYLIKNDEFICGAEKVSDGTNCLLHVKNNKVLWSKDIDVRPVQLVVTDDMTVYFTSQKDLYRTNYLTYTTEVIRNDLAEISLPCLHTDGNRIVYPKDNSPTYSWYIYDPETSEEKYIVDADRCAGFTDDGDLVITYRPSTNETANFSLLKKINTTTLKQQFFYRSSYLTILY